MHECIKDRHIRTALDPGLCSILLGRQAFVPISRKNQINTRKPTFCFSCHKTWLSYICSFMGFTWLFSLYSNMDDGGAIDQYFFKNHTSSSSQDPRRDNPSLPGTRLFLGEGPQMVSEEWRRSLTVPLMGHLEKVLDSKFQAVFNLGNGCLIPSKQ